jgi:hypothetical protein
MGARAMITPANCAPHRARFQRVPATFLHRGLRAAPPGVEG